MTVKNTDPSDHDDIDRNRVRAERGLAILQNYAGSQPGIGLQDALGDVLTDLKHAAFQNLLNFPEADRISDIHFDDELEGDGDI